jgi:hypothetical protein
MKSILQKIVVCASCLVLTESAFGDQPPYSLNVVGYINTIMQPGVNLIADQLLGTPNNTLDTILNAGTSNGGLADNTSFTMWSSGAFLPTSFYDAIDNSWSINYTLTLGQGGYLTSSSLFTNTFVGTVGPYAIINTVKANVIPTPLPWTPNYPNGLQLISDPSPFSGTLDTEFYNVTGRNPVNGEGVAILDSHTQTYNISYYTAGSGWQNANLTGPSTAALNVGQAAWFALGANYSMTIPSPVPEPGVLALTGLGFGVLLILRRHK